jgi:hypothetical protein
MPRNVRTFDVIPSAIDSRILVLRGQKVMIDQDLAVLYGTSTKALNQGVKRNADRFPSDFMFRLNIAEKTEVVTNCDHLQRLKFSRTLPHAFTEHGALMLASVLNTPRAIDASVFVVRAFVRLRQAIVSHDELARKLGELERTVGSHDSTIKQLVQAIRQLMTPPPSAKGRPIGFHAKPQ